MNDEQGRRRGNRTTALDEGEVAACPECNGPHVRTANRSSIRSTRDDAESYACYKCGERFNEYVVRPRRAQSTVARSGLSKRLLDADADEVGR